MDKLRRLNTKINAAKEKYYWLVYLSLIAFGIFCAYNVVKPIWYIPIDYYDGDTVTCYMSLRLDWLRYLLEDLKTNGVFSGLHRLYDHNATMYLYLTHIGKWLNLPAEEVFLFVQMCGIFSFYAVYPSCIYKLTNSVAASLIAQGVFLGQHPYTLFALSDSYWVYSWCALIAFPVLLSFLVKKWQKSNNLWAVFLMVVISIANCVRGGSAIGITALLFIVVLLKLIIPAVKKGSFNKKMLLNGVLIIVFTVFSSSLLTSTVPSIYQKATNQPPAFPTKGPWHSLYIGLGWMENPLGIEYIDSYGLNKYPQLLFEVKEEDGVYTTDMIGIESPEYHKAIKKDYFNAVFSHPIFFTYSYIRKAIRCTTITIDHCILYWWPVSSTLKYVKVFLGLPLLYIAFLYIDRNFTKNKKEFLKGTAAFLTVFALLYLGGLAPGVMSFPAIDRMGGAAVTIDSFFVVLFAVSITWLLKEKPAEKSLKTEIKE